jgi:hypothetical protein
LSDILSERLQPGAYPNGIANSASAAPALGYAFDTARGSAIDENLKFEGEFILAGWEIAKMGIILDELVNFIFDFYGN